MLRREQERIFARSWQYVGHTGQLAGSGDFFPARLGRIPVVVVRDDEDAVRAFLNVCRHRGCVLVDEPGNRRTLQCPYHAWTYALDGRLLAAPRAEREPQPLLDASDLALVELPLGRFGPFLFVNADRDAPAFGEVLGDLPALVASAGIDVAALRFHHRSEWKIEANWKLVCENFLECYHCPVAHPGFSALVDVSPEAYRVETNGLLSSQYGPLREDPRPAYDAAGEVSRGQFHFLWPNTGINIFPGRANVSIGSIDPLAPGRTARVLDYFFAADADESWIDELLAFDDQIGREDTQLVERTQIGVASGALERGRLLAASEELVAGFQSLVRDALGD